MRASLLLILVLSFFLASGQKLANHWYFGQNAGLSFESGSPVAVFDGKLDTREGCASISSEDGALLFYTDGTKVWNRNHEQMPNGFDLKGNIGSTQSAIIVAKPGSNKLYYVFTIDAVEHNSGEYGINYSLVDMDLEGGLGDVVNSEKNVNLTTGLCEKVTSVVHANEQDVWVISQKYMTNHLYVYHVSDQGVNPTPIISEEGAIINTYYNAVGYMKVSPDGGFLVKANSGLNSVEVFDFDNATGEVSNARTIDGFTTKPYGIEFSPNGKLLYVNAENNSAESLFQFNLDAGSIDDIIASKYVVADQKTSGALQLGPDKRLYVGQNGSTALSTVNSPNKIGGSCNFVYEDVDLGGRKVILGLPTFVQSYFAAISADFYFQNTCLGDVTNFYDNSSQEPDSVLWNFDDPASGTENTSKLSDPQHLFTTTGNYEVLLTVWKEEIESSKTIEVQITSIPTADAGPDQLILTGSSTTLTAEGSSGGVPPYNYLWEPSAKLLQNNVSEPETVILTASQVFTLNLSDSKNCSSTPSEVTINISTGETLAAFPKASPDTICRGQSVQITANAVGGSGLYEYEWTSVPEGFTSEEASFSVEPEITTTYKLKLKDTFNQTINEQLKVLVKATPLIDLIPEGIDTITEKTIIVCVKDSVLLDAGWENNPPSVLYNWNNTGLNERYLLAISSGTWLETQKHSVVVTNPESECTSTDSITIIFAFSECEIGIEEKETNVFAIIPNPNSGKFKLVFKETVSNPILRIFDLSGKEIHLPDSQIAYSKGDGLNVNIDFLKAGIYFISLQSDEETQSKKLIIY